MRLIEKFAEEVFKNNGSFTIKMSRDNKEDGNKTYHFLQDEVGKARYVYGFSNYWNEDFYAQLDAKPKIIAIVSDENIYVLDVFFLDIYVYGNDKVTLPNNVFILEEYTAEQNENISNTIFHEFYNKLGTDENSITDSEKELKEKARSYIFSKSADLPNVELKPLLNVQDIAHILCGFTDFEKEVKERLNKDKEQWIRKKSTDKKIKSLMENSETAACYEIEIADGIRSVEAKTVTVEFELNGKVVSAKINPDIIIRKMVQNDYFSGYDFEIAKRGDELIKGLGASTWRSGNNGNELLTCKNISKITYGKKELYVRK